VGSRAGGSRSTRGVSTLGGRATFAWCPDLTGGCNDVDGNVVDNGDDGRSVVPSRAGPRVCFGIVRGTGVPSVGDCARGDGLFVPVGIDHPLRNLACLVCAARRKESGCGEIARGDTTKLDVTYSTEDTFW